MTIKDFEKIRKKKFPIYMSLMLSGFIFMLIAVIFLIFIDLDLLWWQFLILVMIALGIIFGLILSADRVERKFFFKYNQLYQKHIVGPLVEEVFGQDSTKMTKELDLSKITLIGKSHKYQVINEIHTNEFSIYEITMMRDLRFRGFIIKKPLNKNLSSFLFMNYNYYYRPKIYDMKIKTDLEEFDNRYLLFSSNPDFVMPTKLANRLFKRLQTFNQVGVMVNENVAYYVLGHRVTGRQQNYLNISLIDELEEDVEVKIKIFIQKLQAIAEYDFD